MQLNSLHRILLPAFAAVSLFAQPAVPPKVTTVMATLTVRQGITREQIASVMQNEVRDTVNLYLDGKIREWYARGDGKGVVFFIDCKTVEEAQAILGKLPLIQADFASFEYMPLGPLSPLRLLVTPIAK